jgi:hypothetical protein
MPRQNKPDPYDGFKNDQERRLALNTRVRSYALTAMVVAIAGAPIDWMEKFRWAMHVLH